MSNKEYIASIITPFHNTDIALFRKGFESVCAQTIGVEHIEWLIVVHNSDDSYLQAVRKLINGHDNFKVFELHNEAHSASSPRNFALDHAAGKYLFFLDSDDRLMPECIEEVTKKMEQTSAVLAKIRATKELEDENVMELLDTRVRYDQTESIIMLHKEDSGIKDIMTEPHMTPWGQVYLREFIEKHHIRYNENISMGEDMDFTIRAMKYVDKILVLPQTIGYVYYINHASTLQQMGNITPDVVIGFANAVRGVIDPGIDAGLDIRYLFWSFANIITNMMDACPQMSEDQRNMLRKSMGRYFDIVEPLDADGKIYTETQAEDIMNRARAAFGKLAESEDEFNIEDQVLLSIIHENADTDIGRKYQFNLIHNQKAFRSRLPITDYSFYAPLIRLSTIVGEKKIFCSDDVEGYALEIEASGEIKRFPITKKHLIPYVTFFGNMISGKKGSSVLMIPTLPKDHENKDNSYNNHISGAVLNQVKKSLVFNSPEKSAKEHTVTFPKELIFPNETFNPKYVRLLFALADPSVVQIVSESTWTLLEMFEYLERHYDLLVEDIRIGRIRANEDLPEEMRNRLKPYMKADPKRADELAAIFKEGFDWPIIPKIWPDFERIVSVGIARFKIYTRRLKRYTGSSVVFDNCFFATPEALIGVSLKSGDDRYKLLNSYDYLEFLPIGENTKESLLSPADLIPENDYEVIVTNHAGLYRYRTGNIIHVESMEGQVPIFTFLRMADDVCELNGISLASNQVYEAVMRIADDTGIDIADYAYGIDEKGNSFRIWLEPSSVGIHYQKAIDISGRIISEKADKILGEISDDYRAARSSGTISKSSAYILEPETQIMKRDRDMYMSKIMSDQMKPVRIIRDDITLKFFMKLSH